MSRSVGDRTLIALVLALLVLHLRFSLAPALLAIRNDFANYYVPARAVIQGSEVGRLYERDWFQAELRRAGLSGFRSLAPNPPAAVLPLLPLAALPPPPAKAAWTGLLALCLAAAFLVLRRALPVSAWLLALVFLLPSASVANALLYGQPYPLLLLCLCLGLASVARGHEFRAGLLVSPVVALKLYGLPFVLYFLWTRRWRALAGLTVGVAALTLLSLASLGPAAHVVYLREILPTGLTGTVQDPYSTIWGSLASLARRLLQFEPDLNPQPVADRPELARALAAASSVAVVLLSVLAARAQAEPHRLRREWAVVTLGALAASPLVASYHVVLLVLPAAILVCGEDPPRPWRVAPLLALLAFATSPLPHYFARFASGWANLLAYPRLAALLVLFAVAVRPMLSARRAMAAGLLGILVGLAASRGRVEEPWTRVAEARGYLLAEPSACSGGLAWVTIERGESERLVVRAPDGGVLRGGADLHDPRCVGGRLFARSNDGGGETHVPPRPDPWCGPGAGFVPPSVDLADLDAHACGRLVVWADRAAAALRERDTEAGSERTLARGPIRRPRLSPDGAWVVYQAWEGGSWDIRAVGRASLRVVPLTADPANEVEPSWMPGGERVVFASDRRRGLGSTALYTVPFRP